MSRLTVALSTFLARAGWLAAAITIGLGGAGLVTALDNRPGAGGRAELTWAGDQAVRGPLEAVVGDLDAIAIDFDALGSQGRAALAALVAADPDGLDRAIAAGQAVVEKIAAESRDLGARLDRLPGTGPAAQLWIGADVLDRIASARAILGSTGGIDSAWATLSAGSSSAGRLATLLARHDELSGEAVRQGSQGRYADAVGALDLSDPVLAQARELRDRLPNTADTSTLTQWLNRNAAIDTALRRLYTELAATGGTVTPEARLALDQVAAAQASLPPDTRALVVIMADLARAGLNQAVIRIEESRGRVTRAIELLRRAPALDVHGPGSSGEPGSTVEPDPTGAPEVTPPDA